MRKMDEMESRINDKGIKWSWFFMIVSLAIWGIYNYVVSKETSLPLVLLWLQFLVYFCVTSVQKIKVDDFSAKRQIVIAAVIMLLLILFGVILYLTVGR